MKLANFVLLAAIVAVPGFGQKKGRPQVTPPVGPPTGAQMRVTYDLSTKQILAQSKYPPSVRLSPFQDSWFVNRGQVAGNDVIRAYIVFDGQNGLGAMVRSTGMCDVNAAAGAVICHGLDFDMVAMHMIPKDAVRGSEPANSEDAPKRPTATESGPPAAPAPALRPQPAIPPPPYVPPPPANAQQRPQPAIPLPHYVPPPLPANAQQPSTQFQSALESLQEVRLLYTTGGFGVDAFAIRMMDVRVKVDKYLRSEPRDTKAGHLLRAAMLEYDLLRYAIAVAGGNDLMLPKVAEVITDRDVASCPSFQNLTKVPLKPGQLLLRNYYEQNYQAKRKLLGQDSTLTDAENLALNFMVSSPGIGAVPKCAADDIALAEQIGSEPGAAVSSAPPEQATYSLSPRAPVAPPANHPAQMPQPGGLKITGSEQPDSEAATRVITLPSPPATLPATQKAATEDTPAPQEAAAEAKPTTFVGPNGGRYHYVNGKKVYEKKKQ